MKKPYTFTSVERDLSNKLDTNFSYYTRHLTNNTSTKLDNEILGELIRMFGFDLKNILNDLIY